MNTCYFFSCSYWLLFFCYLSYAQNHNSCSYTRKYNYEEANRVLCPNRTWRNVSDVLGDEALKKIEEKIKIRDVKGLLEHCAEQIVTLEIDLDRIKGIEYRETADRLQIEAKKLKDLCC